MLWLVALRTADYLLSLKKFASLAEMQGCMVFVVDATTLH